MVNLKKINCINKTYLDTKHGVLVFGCFENGALDAKQKKLDTLLENKICLYFSINSNSEPSISIKNKLFLFLFLFIIFILISLIFFLKIVGKLIELIFIKDEILLKCFVSISIPIPLLKLPYLSRPIK